MKHSASAISLGCALVPLRGPGTWAVPRRQLDAALTDSCKNVPPSMLCPGTDFAVLFNEDRKKSKAVVLRVWPLDEQHRDQGVC